MGKVTFIIGKKGCGKTKYIENKILHIPKTINGIDYERKLNKKRKVLIIDICDEYRRYDRLSDTEIINFCSDEKAKGVRRVTIFNDKDKKRSLSQMYDLMYKKIFPNFKNGTLIIDGICLFSKFNFNKMFAFLSMVKEGKSNINVVFTFMTYVHINRLLNNNGIDVVSNIVLFKTSDRFGRYVNFKKYVDPVFNILEISENVIKGSYSDNKYRYVEIDNESKKINNVPYPDFRNACVDRIIEQSGALNYLD